MFEDILLGLSWIILSGVWGIRKGLASYTSITTTTSSGTRKHQVRGSLSSSSAKNDNHQRLIEPSTEHFQCLSPPHP